MKKIIAALIIVAFAVTGIFAAEKAVAPKNEAPAAQATVSSPAEVTPAAKTAPKKVKKVKKVKKAKKAEAPAAVTPTAEAAK